MSRNLLIRVAFAVPAIALTVLVLRLGGWWLALVLAVLGMLGAWEVYGLARRQGIAPLAELGYVGAAAIPFGALAGARGEAATWASAALYAGVFGLLLLLVAAMFVRGSGGRPLTAVAVTLFGALYAAAPLAFLVVIRHGGSSDREPASYFLLTMLPLALTWICDTAAYGVGTTLGGPKLAPVLSPHKTWSGAIGGLAGALAGSVVLGLLVLNGAGWRFGIWQLLGVGLVVGVIGQAGDVAESLLKREAGVKDSSTLVPGHGGVLDRLDSLYFVIPASAALFELYGVI
ncbi:MAG TPA: phosphatidate cytidylyltransferase [Gemmatimonadales bacterium]